MSKNPINVQLFLRKSDITIVCSECQTTMVKREVPFTSLTNFPLPHGSNLPWEGCKNNNEVTIQKCKHCGKTIKVTAEIKAEIVEENTDLEKKKLILLPNRNSCSFFFYPFLSFPFATFTFAVLITIPFNLYPFCTSSKISSSGFSSPAGESTISTAS